MYMSLFLCNGRDSVFLASFGRSIESFCIAKKEEDDFIFIIFFRVKKENSFKKKYDWTNIVIF